MFSNNHVTVLLLTNFLALYVTEAIPKLNYSLTPVENGGLLLQFLVGSRL